MILVEVSSPGQKEPYCREGIAGTERRTGMPFIIVNMWPGRDDDAKRRIAEGITDVLVKEKVPRDVISVIFNEVPKNNWAEAGKLCSDSE